MSSYILWVTNHPYKGLGQCHIPKFTKDKTAHCKLWGPQCYLWNGWSWSRQILYTARLYQHTCSFRRRQPNL